MAVNVSSPEIEANTLGLILDNPTLIDTLDQPLKTEYFTGDRYIVAVSIMEIVNSGRLPDLPSVAQEMEEKYKDRFEHMGGRSFLLELQTSIPYSDVSINQYIEKLRSEHAYRRLIDLGHQAARMGETRFGDTPVDAISAVQDELLSIADRGYRNDSFQKFDDALDTLADVLVQRTNTPDGIVGVPTPWEDINRCTFGLHPGDLIVVAARPGVGKSTFGVNLCAFTALEKRIPTLMFSLEMTNSDLMERFVSGQTMIPFSRIRKGQLSESEWAKVSKFNNDFSRSPLYLDDSSSTSMLDIRNKAAKVKAIHGYVGLIIVDYIGLLTSDGKHSAESRQQEVSEISRSLKILAKDFHCPVVALSQLNRGVENRPNKRPHLSDIRDSGSVEQDSGVVMGLYLDQNYYPTSGDHGIMEVIVLKNRHGESPTIRLGFINQLTKLVNLG